MTDYKLGCDLHKRYSQIAVLNAELNVALPAKGMDSPSSKGEKFNTMGVGTGEKSPTNRIAWSR
jgi:hypothetical protein